MGEYALKINKFEYEYLTNSWDGPNGAAFNVVSEACHEAGYCNRWSGKITEKGKEQIRLYEESKNDSS